LEKKRKKKAKPLLTGEKKRPRFLVHDEKNEA